MNPDAAAARAARSRYRTVSPGPLGATARVARARDLAILRAPTAHRARGADEVRLPFAGAADDAPAVHVVVDASGELVAVLRRDGRAGVVHDTANARTRQLPALGAEVEALFALRLSPVAVGWWTDGEGLGYVALDLARGEIHGPWEIPGGAAMVLGPADELRVLRQRDAAPTEAAEQPVDDSDWPDLDALFALPEGFGGPDGPWEIAVVAAPGEPPETEVELPPEVEPDRAWPSPDGRWLHEPPSVLRRDVELRLIATSAEREDLALGGTAGLRSALIAFGSAGDRVLVGGGDGRELRLRTYGLPGGALVAETRFDASLHALWPVGSAGVAAAWVSELLVWRDARTPAPPIRLALPGEASLTMDLGVGSDPSGAVVAVSDGATLAIHRLDARTPGASLPHVGAVTGTAVARAAPRLISVDGASVVVTTFPRDGAPTSVVAFRAEPGAPTIFGPAVDAAGRRIAWCRAGVGHGAALLDLGEGAVRELAAGETVTAIAVHPAGDLVAAATGAVDSTVTLSRWADGQPVGRLSVENVVYALAFSGDGGRLAVASRSGELSLWDLSRGEALARASAPLERFDQRVTSVAFGPAGAIFLTEAGAAHRLGADGAVALDVLALGGAPSPSAGGRFTVTPVERHRVRLARLDDGGAVRDVLVEPCDLAALLPDGRLVTLEVDERTVAVHPLPEAVDPSPPAASLALAPVGPGASWASVEAPSVPTGLGGAAAHHWRALRRSLEARAPALGHGEAEIEAIAAGLLPRVARALVAAEALARLLALFELGRAPLGGDAGPPRGAGLAERLARWLPRAGRFLEALTPAELGWTAAERDLVGALTEVDDWGALAAVIDDLSEQLAFEGALCRRRDAPPETRPGTVAALRAVDTLPAALGVAASDLGGIDPARPEALAALVEDEDAEPPAVIGAALVLALREEVGHGPHLVAAEPELLELLDEVETLFALRCFVAGLEKM